MNAAIKAGLLGLALSAVACGGSDLQIDTEAEGLGAVVDTTIHNGTPACDTQTLPFGVIESCMAMEGVGHTTETPNGKWHYIFHGSRTQTLSIDGVQVSEIYTEEHRAVHLNDGMAFTLHIDGCSEIDGGALSFDFYTQMANGEIVSETFEIGADCDF